ncbi:MAG: branched-chain amino acid ABC transporter substrate-binding protein, partial [Pseudogulbenkiania sp.]|nr:branched-chain amino acid ABC transporter substrate-binding protein [Pseudogulbenkiania sp.]
MTLIKMSCLAVAVAGLAACGQKAEQAADAGKTAPAAGELVVKIGHAGPITGPAANYGKDSENGAQIAV